MVLPYLKGLVIILCGFFYLALWIYCVFSICGDYILDLFRFLTIGIRALSLGRHCGQIFFIFADFFFSEKKKQGRDILEVFGTFM
jgi:hypothetical protein